MISLMILMTTTMQLSATHSISDGVSAASTHSSENMIQSAGYHEVYRGDVFAYPFAKTRTKGACIGSDKVSFAGVACVLESGTKHVGSKSQALAGSWQL